MRVGIADHLGWAVVVVASDDHDIVDRRRIELVEQGVPPMPIHDDSKRLDVAGTEALVARVRASVVRATSRSLDALAGALPAPITSVSIRAWPLDFPEDIATQRVAPYEAWADGVMYRRILADLVGERGWAVHRYDAKRVVDRAGELLGGRAEDVLDGPRARLGPPWTKDHRTALAATVVAG